MERTKTELKPNPRDKSNILSVLSFAWTIPLFRKGLSKHLEIDDICEPRECDKSHNLAERLNKYDDQIFPLVNLLSSDILQTLQLVTFDNCGEYRDEL